VACKRVRLSLRDPAALQLHATRKPVTLDGAVKDTGLIAAVLRQTGTDATLVDAVAQQYRNAADGGHGGEDMAAVIRAFRR
jgi:3-hydroxyisobutyrate dehydrogenase-like beta-hydroxyacid dehydrogenase